MPKGKKTGGRKPGSLNKTTIEVKSILITAHYAIGGQDTFNAWAKQNLTEYYKLLSKLLPTEINANISGGLAVEFVEEIVEPGIIHDDDGDGPEAIEDHPDANPDVS